MIPWAYVGFRARRNCAHPAYGTHSKTADLHALL